MSLSSLTAKADFDLGARVHPRGRRGSLDILGDADAAVRPVAEVAATFANPFDTAYYARRFKADLSELKAFAGEHDEANAPSADPDHEGDALLFDFFGNLSVLLVSVRMGDIERARAAADALALEVMIERSAGERAGDPNRPHVLDDLRQMLNAAQSGDERAARAAAKALARDVGRALEAPPAPPPPLADAPPIADATAAAYETLIGYIDEDTPTAV